MSNEDRQRVIRRAGFKPAQAETEERARKSREAKREEEAELQRQAADAALVYANARGEASSARRALSCPP
jgi:hypothetical protein